jgi:hypothetical protein
MPIKRLSLSTRITSLVQLHSLIEGLLFFTFKRLYDPSHRTSHIIHPFTSCFFFLAQNPSIIFQSFLFLSLTPQPAPPTITPNSPAPPLLYPQHAHVHRHACVVKQHCPLESPRIVCHGLAVQALSGQMWTPQSGWVDLRIPYEVHLKGCVIVTSSNKKRTIKTLIVQRSVSYYHVPN